MNCAGNIQWLLDSASTDPHPKESVANPLHLRQFHCVRKDSIPGSLAQETNVCQKPTNESDFLVCCRKNSIAILQAAFWQKTIHQLFHSRAMGHGPIETNARHVLGAECYHRRGLSEAIRGTSTQHAAVSNIRMIWARKAHRFKCIWNNQRVVQSTQDGISDELTFSFRVRFNIPSSCTAKPHQHTNIQTVSE